ncbi:MAG: HD domain-containing protein [Deltaproteobacteria bacterium]|nr:HD domain-containing protein [Deltaproteobacteria bacterium]
MQETFEKTKNWFETYVEGFFTNDSINNSIIRLKLDHTHRVCHNAAILADALKLNSQDHLNARLTALLHDVGRFRQFSLYQTFNDAVSDNHALMGIREIECHGVLDGLDAEDRRLICRAIACHNVPALPEEKDERSLLFMRLIRDADKLDVYKVLLQNYRDQDRDSRNTVLHKLPDTPHCSPKILDALLGRKVAKFEDMKTLNDFKLLKVGWVYDLNFSASFKILQHHRYIEQLKEILPTTEPVTTAVDQALAYVASRL